jgi:ubiquinone/menaquinone biosynthesis C-methylase UbiE
MPIQKDPEGIEILHLEEAAAFTGAYVLEIGCGDGRLTWRFAPSAGRVTALDTDTLALKTAVASRPDNLRQTVSFVCASSLDLPFPNEEFNIAILAWSL